MKKLQNGEGKIKNRNKLTITTCFREFSRWGMVVVCSNFLCWLSESGHHQGQNREGKIKEKDAHRCCLLYRQFLRGDGGSGL